MKALLTLLLISLISNLTFAQCEDFEVEVSIYNPTCWGFSDGSVTLTISGVPPYTVEITNTDGDVVNEGGGGTANTLTTGWYYIYVIDDAGCIFEDSVLLNHPGPIEVDLVVEDQIEIGICDGYAKADTVYNYAGDYGSISYFWSGHDDPGGLGVKEITDVCPGEYVLTVNDENGCSNAVDFEVEGTIGINEYALHSIQVIPNRQTGEIQLMAAPTEKMTIRLYNLSGKEVFNVETADHLIQLNQHLGQGIYIYEIEVGGNQIQTGKIMW